MKVGMVLFFFFQAEDGIRDGRVTGVQTCALPIWRQRAHGEGRVPLEVAIHEATSEAGNASAHSVSLSPCARPGNGLPGCTRMPRGSTLRPCRASQGMKAAERNREEDDMSTNQAGAQQDESPSRLIDERIRELGDWRGKTLSRVRSLIRQADPEVVEEWKWRGVPVWSHDGMICTGETYKNVVKMTFHKGASLKDPSGLFNSSLDGNVRRAIDLHEGEDIDEEAFKNLFREAVALNAHRRA